MSRCPAAAGQGGAAASLPGAQQVLEGWMSCFQKHLQVPAAFTEQLHRANEGTALIKQPPSCFVLYGVANKWWTYLGIDKIEVWGVLVWGVPHLLLFQVSPRLSSRRRRCSFPWWGWLEEGECCLLRWAQGGSPLDEGEQKKSRSVFCVSSC